MRLLEDQSRHQLVGACAVDVDNEMRHGGSADDRVGSCQTGQVIRELATLTRPRLIELGLSVPAVLAEATLLLWRSSPKAKYHWADHRVQCQHVAWGDRWCGPPNEDPPVTDRVPALGFDLSPEAVCKTCSGQISVSEDADTFVAIAAQLDETMLWIARGRELVDSDCDWLRFARWQALAPLQGDVWMEAAASLKGGWRSHGLELRNAIVLAREDMLDVRQALCDSISDDPAHTALLERALRMVEADSAALAESDRLVRVGGGANIRTSFLSREQLTPWRVTAGMWFTARTRGETLAVGEVADRLDGLFPHVHDLAALECRVDVPYEAGDCVHSWAKRQAAAERREVVEAWITRLDLALEGLRGAGSAAGGGVGDHLVVVDRWPLTDDRDALIAYLAQFEPVCGPFTREDAGAYVAARQVAVLRVPGWAAEHAGDLLEPMRCEPVCDGDRYQAIRLAREAGIALMPDDFGSRRQPSALVVEERQEVHGKVADSDLGMLHPWRGWPRPLAVNAAPPGDPTREWTKYAVLEALSPGAEFVFGYDDVELLKLGFPPDSSTPWCVSVVVSVEIQAAFHDRHGLSRQGPCICDVAGTLVATTKDGGLVMVPEGMRDPVSIPPTYLVAATVTR